MSTWRNVGITYLKYADICATHVRNALKEPAKTKAKSASNMHARIVQWEAGKRGEPGEPRPPGPVAPRSRRAGWFAGAGALRARGENAKSVFFAQRSETQLDRDIPRCFGHASCVSLRHPHTAS